MIPGGSCATRTKESQYKNRRAGATAAGGRTASPTEPSNDGPSRSCVIDPAVWPGAKTSPAGFSVESCGCDAGAVAVLTTVPPLAKGPGVDTETKASTPARIHSGGRPRRRRTEVRLGRRLGGVPGAHSNDVVTTRSASIAPVSGTTPQARMLGGPEIETRCERLVRQRMIRRFIEKTLRKAKAYRPHLSPALSWWIAKSDASSEAVSD